MKTLYTFPKAAHLGRVLTKEKIYTFASPPAKVKKLFVDQVEKITWSYNLTSKSINLPASKKVQEIQVFTVRLRTPEVSHELLQTLDKAIPSPLIYILQFNGNTRYAAAYKRPSEADKNKWVISSYFESDWISDDSSCSELPVVLNMWALYRALLASLAPLSFRVNETLDELVTRIDLLRSKEREAIQLEKRMHKEKQFNRRVEMNRKLNGLKEEIGALKI